MQQAGYHHANHLASQLREDIEKRDIELLTVLQSTVETNSVQSSPPSLAPSLVPSEMSMTASTLSHQANSVQGDPVQLEILKLLRQMQQTMVSPPQQSNKGNNSGQRNRRRQPRKTLDNATFNRNVTDKYCWTHGACGHESNQCNAKAHGHQDNATLENRMGGSNAFCNP